jgi:phospholipid-translocating ATPase
LFYLTQALYQRSVGYTGTSLYESWSLSMFNTLFTSLPVIFMGVFEKDLAASTLLAVPELYTKGQRNGGFNFKVYLGWMFMASTEAMLVYFVMLKLWGEKGFSEDNSIFAMGVCTYTAIVWVIAMKMQYVSPPFFLPNPISSSSYIKKSACTDTSKRFIETHTKSALNALAIFCSVGGWFLWNIILSCLYKTPSTIYYVRATFLQLFGRSLAWWCTLLLIILSVATFEFATMALRAAWWTTDEDVFQALEKDPDVKRRFEEAASMELQAGWDRASNKEKAREDMTREVVEKVLERDQERREREVGELLMMRTRAEEERVVDVDQVLKSGYGDVR